MPCDKPTATERRTGLVLTHWAPWDAPRYKQSMMSACGLYCRDRDLATHGEAPTCHICLRRFREFEDLPVE